MSTLGKVRCTNCKKGFYKSKGHIKENLKLGHNFYCSLNCQSEYRRTGKWLICENDLCKKKFYRKRHAILKYNYCSQSCAAIVNNQKYPKWPIRYCKICKKIVKREGTPYCSIECGKAGKFKYTKEEIVKIIRKYHKETGRIPAKREILEVSYKSIHLFGSWNKVILAAGLKPNRSHDNRMYKRINTKALDGHLCDSVSEALIDNWLTRNNISHERDVSYPNTNHKADWGINGNKIFVEYFGLAKDSPRYDRSVRKKKKLCEKFKIKLIEIYPKDLYPRISLDHKLKNLWMGSSGVQ